MTNLQKALALSSEKLFGLENACNWGFDWFASREEADRAKSARPKLYGHNDAPLVMTRQEIIERGL